MLPEVPSNERGVARSWVQSTLQGSEPPTPGNAVAALLVLEDGRYLMQLRDAKPGIFYPDHWGCFGGGVNESETPWAALRRELTEELGYSVRAASEFTRFDFDFRPLGHASVSRIYFVVPIPDSAIGRLVLGEGAAMSAVRGEELLTSYRLTPYDAFAIWMHLSALRFGSAAHAAN